MAQEQPSREQLEQMAEDVFSSERREDIWAIVIAVAVLIAALFVPDQIQEFFKDTLFLF